MTEMSPANEHAYTAVIVTFRRASSLATVLEGLRQQSIPPSLTVVADNDPDQSARATVDEARESFLGELVYAPVGENLGPSGGWAHAVSVAALHPTVRGDWVLVVDDDDPLEAPELVAALLQDANLHGARVAGVGLRGSRWNKWRAVLGRLDPPENAVAEVDYLAGNGAPLYSWAAIDAVGFFKPDLFFGFEDLDYGFRLRAAGWRLLVAPHPSLHTVADTGSARTPWREYYKTRALVWILREHVGTYAVAVTLLRSVLLGGLRLWVVERELPLFKARLLGACDAVRNRLGVRRYFPGSNPPKSVPSQGSA